MTNKLVVVINSLKVPKIKKILLYEISCTKLQLPPELLTRGLPLPDPRSLCPQLNLLNPPPNKFPGYATEWLYKNISSISKKFFNYKHSQHSTLLFNSNLLPSSGSVATDTEILHMTPWHIVLARPHAPT